MFRFFGVALVAAAVRCEALSLSYVPADGNLPVRLQTDGLHGAGTFDSSAFASAFRSGSLSQRKYETERLAREYVLARGKYNLAAASESSVIRELEEQALLLSAIFGVRKPYRVPSISPPMHSLQNSFDKRDFVVSATSFIFEADKPNYYPRHSAEFFHSSHTDDDEAECTTDDGGVLVDDDCTSDGLFRGHFTSDGSDAGIFGSDDGHFHRSDDCTTDA